jgi:hypothetical protein
LATGGVIRRLYVALSLSLLRAQLIAQTVSIVLYHSRELTLSLMVEIIEQMLRQTMLIRDAVDQPLINIDKQS